MLRIPRKTRKAADPRQHIHKEPTIPLAPGYGAQLILARNAKITWAQFEALRIKLARALTSKRQLSRKARYKQKAKKVKNEPVSHTKKQSHALSWYNAFPHLAYRTKGRGSRMGKGKGNITSWYYKGRAGQLIVQFFHPSAITLRIALHKTTKLLPVKSRLHTVIGLPWITQYELLD